MVREPGANSILRLGILIMQPTMDTGMAATQVRRTTCHSICVQSQRLAIGALEWVLDKSHPNRGFASRRTGPLLPTSWPATTAGRCVHIGLVAAPQPGVGLRDQVEQRWACSTYNLRGHSGDMAHMGQRTDRGMCGRSPMAIVKAT